jgi:methylmalonyl-CoA carboxyltransferase large subunit
MTNRPKRHVSPEKNLTMAERLERVEQERAHIDSFDRDRELQPGQLTPRARIAALVDDDSFLEIGAFAKSQHRDVAAETPADGLITGYAEIGGRRVVVLAEDPVALAATDAQVGKNKRNRMISNAIYRRLPIVYLTDGTAEESPEFDMHRGFLLGRVADQLPARDIAEREAPLITIACGLCAGQNGSLAVRSDLLVATRYARFGASDGSPDSVADVVFDDDAEAIAAAQRFLGSLPEELGTPLEPLTYNPAAPSNIMTDEFMDATPEEQFESIFDGEGAVLLSEIDSNCVVGLGRIEGFPTAFALTGGSPRASLTTADMKRIARAASWSADYQIPFLSTQDTLGYDAQDAATPEFMFAAARIVESLRASHAAKITIITGWGYALGDFALGGLGTGFDFLWCWPSARLGVTDSPGYLARDPESPPSDGPWKAAELGLVAEMITPADTRSWIARALRLLGPGRALPAAHYDRGQQIHDMT